jgi:hypothetical protein
MKNGKTVPLYVTDAKLKEILSQLPDPRSWSVRYTVHKLLLRKNVWFVSWYAPNNSYRVALSETLFSGDVRTVESEERGSLKEALNEIRTKIIKAHITAENDSWNFRDIFED